MHIWMWAVIALAVVIVALVVAAWVIRQRRQSQQLHESFGPEYDRAVSQYHSKDRAEAALQARQKRVEAMTIRPLTPEDRTRFAQAWRGRRRGLSTNPLRRRLRPTGLSPTSWEFVATRSAISSNARRYLRLLSQCRGELSRRPCDFALEHARRGEHRGPADSDDSLSRAVR